MKKTTIKNMAIAFAKDLNIRDEVTDVQISKWFDSWFNDYGEDLLKAKENLLKKIQDISIVKKTYEKNGDAKHYNSNRVNHLVKCEKTYGTLACMNFCEINAEKYRDRIGKKPNQSIEQELMKIDWYEKASAYYFDKIGTLDEVVVDNTKKYDLPWKEQK